MPNIVRRPIGYTNTVEQLTWTGAGADVPVRAYLIGGGGGGGGAFVAGTETTFQGSTATDPFHNVFVSGTSGYYVQNIGQPGESNFITGYCVVVNGTSVYLNQTGLGQPNATPPPDTVAIRRNFSGNSFYQNIVIDGILYYEYVECFDFVYTAGGGTTPPFGGNGSGGGYATTEFVVRAGDQITVVVGGGGGGGFSALTGEGGGQAGGSITDVPKFNTRTGPGFAPGPDYVPVFDPNWGTFLNTYGVWNVVNGSYYTSFNQVYNVFFPVKDATVTLTMSASHPALVSWNGVPIFTCTTAVSTFEQTHTVTQGFNAIRIQCENPNGEPAGVALTVVSDGAGFSAGRGGNAGGAAPPVTQGSLATDPFFGTIVPGTSGYYEYGRGYIKGDNNFEDFFNPSSWCVIVNGTVVYGPATTQPPANIAVRGQAQGNVYYAPDGYPSLEYTAVACYNFIYTADTVGYGAGGGGGGATVLYLNGILKAVAGGGAGGGGAGYVGSAPTPGGNAPGGVRGRSLIESNGQNGQNPLPYGGGGYGGGGGGSLGGQGGARTEAEVGLLIPGRGGEYGSSVSYTGGEALNSTNQNNAGFVNIFNFQPYSLTEAGRGGNGETQLYKPYQRPASYGGNGLVVLEFEVDGLYVHTNGEWVPVQKTFVHTGGLWVPVVTTWINYNNLWVPVRGSIAPVLNQHPNLFGINSRVADPAPAPAPVPQGGGGGGRCKIICQKLAEMGFFDSAMNAADQQFGIMLQDQDPDAYNGYLRWAQPVVDLLEGQGSATFRKIAFFWVRDEQRRQQIQSNIVAHYLDVIARPWAEEMAYRMKADGYAQSNPAGRFIMNIGLPMCRAIGRFGKRGQWPMWAKTALIWGTTTVLLVAVSVISGTDKFVGKVCKLFKRG
jgi:hypothetical protein